VRPENWTPFAPNGFSGISAGAAIVFFAYIGFDAVSTVAEETKNPQRNLPIGIIASLIICTVFYVIVSAVFTGLISLPDLQAKLATEQAEPLTMALEHANPNLDWAVGIVAFGSVIAHTAVLLVFQLGQPRIFFSMARDGLLPGAFKKVHKRFLTPHLSTILTGIFVGVFAAIASIDEMVDLTNIGTLFAFILVCAGIIVLRVKDPNRPRPFRVPGGLVLPVLGILSCLYLIYFLPPTSWLRFAAWLNLGFVIYVGYGAVHSRLTGRHLSDPAEHDARSAAVGCYLAIGGAALLFVTRAFDILLQAKKTMGLGEAIGQVFRSEPWLSRSWFLIVPLSINAFLLCVIVIVRARRAIAAKVGPPLSTRAATALTLALTLMVLTAIYLVLVLASGGEHVI
jgi:amino acid transporter